MGKKSTQKENREVLNEHINFRLSVSEAAAIDRLAAKSGKSRSEALRGLVRKIRA